MSVLRVTAKSQIFLQVKVNYIMDHFEHDLINIELSQNNGLFTASISYKN